MEASDLSLILVGLALLLLLFLIAFLGGALTLVGWGVRLVVQSPADRNVRLLWLVFFLLFMPVAQMAYSILYPTPRPFKVLAIATAVVFLLILAMTYGLLAVMRAVGVPIAPAL